MKLNIENNVYLAHHGVKGMKWGVSKNRSTKVSNMSKTTKKLSVNNYVKNQAKGAAIVSAMSTAPISAYLTYRNTKSGKAAVAKYIANVGMSSIVAATYASLSNKAK